jgi:hypothetical protein
MDEIQREDGCGGEERSHDTDNLRISFNLGVWVKC